MTQLETALKLVNDTQTFANVNLDEVPYNVRPGRESQKRQAQADMEKVKVSYQEALQKSLFGILTSGPNANKFSEIAIQEADVLLVDGSSIYKRIADRVSVTMGQSRQFGVSQYSVVIQELRQIAAELNIMSMPSPKWNEPSEVKTQEGLLAHIKLLVDSSIGVGLLKYYIGNQIVEEALKAQASKNTVPVIVTGLDANTSKILGENMFLDNRFILVDTNQEVNKEVVLDVFNKIKKQLKQSKKQKE